MATVSVNTNVGAAIAAQSVNRTASQLAVTQRAVSTGLSVSGARDNGAIFAIAQDLREDVSAVGAVKRSLDRGVGMLSSAIAAGEAIQDVLIEMRGLAVAKEDASLSQGAQDNIDAQFNELDSSISDIIAGAEFDGTNLTGATTVKVLASATDTGKTEVDLGTTDDMDVTSSTDVDDQTTISAAIQTVGEKLASLGGQLRRLEVQSEFSSKLSDALNEGIGALVDADLARESAKLQGLQIKQQLGAQALGIANSSPQVILGFF